MPRIAIASASESFASALAKTLARRLCRPVDILPARAGQITPPTAETAPDLIILDLLYEPVKAKSSLRTIPRLYPSASICAMIPPDTNVPEAERLSRVVDDSIVHPSIRKAREAAFKKLEAWIHSFEKLECVQQRLQREIGLSQIIGKSRAMRHIMARLPQLASCPSTVLITGETGTGKELFARAIHYLSLRAGGPFVTLDCASLPEGVIENELFGHVRGAYTNADSSEGGILKEANGGTLFLDDVQALSLPTQSRFLRFLQNHQYRPVGQCTYVDLDVRILAATNTDLVEAVQKRLFRGDLFYRLSVIPVYLPPLRERPADIPGLVDHFVRLYTGDRTSSISIPECLIDEWTHYSWPGNVRELENRVQEWLFSSRDHVVEHQSEVPGHPPIECRKLEVVRREVLSNAEMEYFRWLLASTHGNISVAARMAGVHRKSLTELLKKYGIDPNRFRR